MGIKIIKPGLLTTIQDGGRYGFQKDGVVVGGAADLLAFKIANLLVGNSQNEAAIEASMLGPKILFEEDQLIVITGANPDPRINNEPVKMWRQIWVSKGSVLELGSSKSGCYTYLAIAGGFDIPKIMNSYATYIRASIGGLEGRALKEDDYLPVKAHSRLSALSIQKLKELKIEKEFLQSKWTVEQYFPDYYGNKEDLFLRALKGPEYALFSEESQAAFWGSSYKITPEADRMGYRLEGKALLLKENKELLSTAVTYGTVQVTSEGMPIILMGDRQTTGGYSRIAQLIAVDLSKLAQALPGTKIYFNEINLQQAYQLYFGQQRLLEQVRKAIHLKISLG